jgi:hypothetical protein
VIDVERATPTVVLVVRNDRDEDILGARALIDGAPQRLAGTPIALDPGEHRLRVEAPDHAPVEQTFVATASEKGRIVRVRLVRESAPPPDRDAAPIDARPSAPAPAPVPLAAWTLGGLAVVAAGSSLVIGLSARDDLDDLERAPCASARTCAESDVQSIKTRFVVADVALGAAIVAAGAAIWIFVARDRGAAPGALARFGVRAAAHGAAFEGSF